ncbi:MAG: 3-deoxy-8-phosphooctulonate synthase [Candidatus Omnitrophica bacterium]|nr:3-deoxy-8-phosphooctulonate synthase [Candidatus Omnitrophota bacterium]
MIQKIKINNIVFGEKKRFVFIGGPCVIENEKSALRHAEKLIRLSTDLKIPFVYKSSFDKANRSSHTSYRGPGLKKGLSILKKIKQEYKIPVVSDVHSVEEVTVAQEVLDIIQIPAFLCRQTDLIFAAAKTGKVVNIKKGQFVSPWEVINIIKKVLSQGNKKILITERGFSFGYNNLVNDFRSIPIIRAMGYPVVFDGTHSVQMPGGLGKISGGMREFIPMLSKCAIAAGVDAIFLEVHEDPSKALCDGPNTLPLGEVKDLLTVLSAIKKVIE